MARIFFMAADKFRGWLRLNCFVAAASGQRQMDRGYITSMQEQYYPRKEKGPHCRSPSLSAPSHITDESLVESKC